MNEGPVSDPDEEDKVSYKLTRYHIRLRCNISTRSSVNLRHLALPRPFSNFLPSNPSISLVYSCSSSSSAWSGSALLKNAHRKNSFTFSRLISAAGASWNHFIKYCSGSGIWRWQRSKSFRRSSRQSISGFDAGAWRWALRGR